MWTATAAWMPAGPLWFWAPAPWQPCCYAVKTTANSKPGDTDVHHQLTAVLGTRLLIFWEVLFAEPFQVLPQVDQRAVFFSIYLNAASIVELGTVRSSEIRLAPLSWLRLCAADPPYWPSWLLLLLPLCGWAQKTHTLACCKDTHGSLGQTSQNSIQRWHWKEHWQGTPSLASGLSCAKTDLSDLGEVQSLLGGSERLEWANTDGFKLRIWGACSVALRSGHRKRNRGLLASSIHPNWNRLTFIYWLFYLLGSPRGISWKKGLTRLKNIQNHLTRWSVTYKILILLFFQCLLDFGHFAKCLLITDTADSLLTFVLFHGAH